MRKLEISIKINNTEETGRIEMGRMTLIDTPEQKKEVILNVRNFLEEWL